ncbi:MAG: hypothetical protein NWF14_04530 [Candidatus Bathyarchaeota archaeon]|nr:hypothetical protein [Candidatus Bathyarchaeota archaeon]
MSGKSTAKFFSIILLGMLFLSLFLCSNAGFAGISKSAGYDAQVNSVISIEDDGASTANDTFEVDEWRREIRIDGWGGFLISDLYDLTNKQEENIYRIFFVLPSNATDISVQDVYGTYEQDRITLGEYDGYVEAEVFLREALEPGQKVRLLVAYRLPVSKYIVQRGWQDYTLNVTLIKRDDWLVRQFALTVSLPEGAEFISSSRTPDEVEKEGFLVHVRFAESNVTEFSEPNIKLEYRYLVIWVAFRPALWVGTAVAALVGVFFIRKASKQVAVITKPISIEVLRKLVDTYEDRRSLEVEIESLERQVRRGKISRRRYKLRRSSLDGRLSRLQKELVEIRGQVAAAGGHYSERMRDLETAETEIETLVRDIRRVEARFRRKEISAEAHRRLLDEYNRIKERAENTIAETLLRLREETR